MRSTMHLERDAIPLDLDAGNFGESARLYAANPLYRAATFDDRVIEDDPYRRPVRPDDLEWIDYSKPVTRANAQELSSLIGHRLLLNIFDTRKVLLPVRFTQERRHEHELFYSERNIRLGEAIRPFLERHVFSFAEAEASERAAGVSDAAIAAGLTGLHQARREAASALAALVSGSPDPRRAGTTVAIQLVGQSLSGPARPPADLAGVVGGPLDRTPAITARGPIEQPLRELFTAAGLRTEPHAYYQFYLPSTFSLMNYLNAAAHNPGRVFRYLGALSAHGINNHALLGCLRQIAGVFGDSSRIATPATAEQALPAWTVDAVSVSVQRWGEMAAREFTRGMHTYAVLLEVHDHDVREQLNWVDSAAACKEKAERLHKAITEHNIQVDLDTFDESAQETSTTHVHDEDRLQIIDSGEMEFYTAFEGTHRFGPGDMMFVPRHRLHGSTVLSGHCTYHQPVITPELDARFGGSPSPQLRPA
jgi:hypothetical protein